jgi:uncharacterized protein
LRKITDYAWHTGKLGKPVRLIVVSDLHDNRYRDIRPLLSGADALLIPGDVSSCYLQRYRHGLAFIGEAAKILPTFLGIGNHETRLKDFPVFARRVTDTGAKFLFNSYERMGDLVIGCWYRPHRYRQADMLPAFQAEAGCRILMSHRPEDYYRWLSGADVDLVLSGHAHGGQIRLFGQGLYAPGQGLFPKYTKGVAGRMIISTGAGSRVLVPRINNPREIVRIALD